MPKPPTTILHYPIQRLREPHQQPAKEKQRQHRNAHNDRKRIPVLLGRVHAGQVVDLHGEIGCHEADGQKDNGEFG